MKKLASVAKADILYGAVTLIPIAIVFLVLVEIVEILESIASAVGLGSASSAAVAIVLALVVVVVFCFTVGAFVRSRVGSLSLERAERAFLLQIPGYRIVKNMVEGFVKSETAFPPALVRLHEAGAAALGFVMEDNGNGTVTVFIPSTPAITVGTLYVVAADQVTVLKASSMEFLDSISQWGVGSGKFLKTTGP
jgi:uncharacterized membrane protein